VKQKYCVNQKWVLQPIYDNWRLEDVVLCEHLWRCFIQCTNIMLNTVHSLRYISYTRRFDNYIFSCPQVIGHYLTYSMELCPFWEANSHSLSQDIPCPLWNLNIHYRVQKSPSLLPLLSLDRSKKPVQFRGAVHFAKSWFFTVRSC
jgi:hypothetical protein